MKTRFQRRLSPFGFSSVELLLVISLSAIVLGSIVVVYGTLARNQPNVGSVVSVALDDTRLRNFYSSTDAERRNTSTAPSYGALAVAEEMREQFYHDVISATAVFCLPRNIDNVWKPSYIPYDRLTDDEIDTPQKFRAHIIRKGLVPSSLYLDLRNPGTSSAAIPTNASIFILSYTDQSQYLRVQAIYDIDVIRFVDAKGPLGFHASVKRFTDPFPVVAGNVSYSLVFSGGYSVFYPPADPTAKAAADFSKDGFTPLFVTFERYTRLALKESTAIDRFKLAAERPFYFIWWPDPAAHHLGAQANTASPTTPQQAYNHMAGRTSFMFTVPLFPAL